MQHKKWVILAAIVIGIFLLLLLGNPSEITYGPFTWKTQEEPLTTPQVSKTPKIEINSFKTKQEIYQPGDRVLVDFKITNELNRPYNITIEWFFNNTRYNGWYTKSTDVYDTSIQENIWNSSITINKTGDWEAYLNINYTYQNETKSTDNVTKFRVV